MNLVEITSPADDAALGVVSLDEMKKHLGIINSARDAAITAAIIDAVAFFDGPYGCLNRSVLPRTWRLAMNGFPGCGRISIPFPPVRAVTAFTYRGGDGEPIEVSADQYAFAAIETSGYLTPVATAGWPYMSSYPDGVVIEFEAGYEVYPALLKRGVKLLAAHYVRNTDATQSTNRDTRANHAIQFGLDHIINALRVPLPYGEA